MKELEQFDEVLCRIRIRPEYKGRKANEKVTYYTGWIASGDMEEVDCIVHEKE